MSQAVQAWLGDFVKREEFVATYRYYAGVLSRMVPIEDHSIPVMAVSTFRGKFYLHINVDYFMAPTHFVYLIGVLLHEVHHIILGHLTHAPFREVKQPRLMELAMEISANEYIRESLPGNPPRASDYSQYGIALGQSTMERYRLLEAAQEAGKLIVMPAMVDTHLGRGVGGLNGQDSDWEDGGDVRLQEMLREALQAADELGDSKCRLAGHTPGHWLQTLADTIRDPDTYMNWRTALEMFIAWQRQPMRSYSRPNRRFPNRIGELPGRMRYPGRDQPKEMLVVLDTSGSMARDELAEIARQLRRLNEYVDFTIVECDTLIHRVYPFNGVLTDVAGRGGTDLRPVFAAPFLEAHPADGVIYFTDGMGPYPAHDPGVRTLWVLTKPWEFHCPWGQIAWMNQLGGD